MMVPCTVAILFGGSSSEHAVSCLSAASVIENIPKDRYQVIPVGITQDGCWMLYSGPVKQIADGSWEKHPANRTAFLSPDRSIKGLVARTGEGFEILPVDVVFPVLHGKNGEDGTVQGLLQLSGIPYVGCGVLSSAICMDKAVTNQLLESAGIARAKSLWFHARDYESRRASLCRDIEETLGGYPIFVKPANAGSSVGISKVKEEAELDAAVAKAAQEDGKIVLEETIVGQEVECAVLGNEEPRASLVGEVGAAAEFYDYDDKYVNGVSKLYIPARIPEETAEAIRKTAIQAYQVLECRGLCRIDFFVRESDGAILLNEPNTLPGFTAISMYPKLWEATGLPYSELLHRLIRLAQAMDG